MATKSKALDEKQIAALMGCKPASAIARLVALGYTEVCGRCGGGGRYSWNQINGDVCFGCAGRGKRLARITAETVATALERIAAGELAAYFAENTARREIERANKALWATYMATTIGKAYGEACDASNRTAIARAREGLGPVDVLETPVGRAQRFLNRLMDCATAALYDRKSAHLKRINIIREVHGMIIAVEAAWAARS